MINNFTWKIFIIIVSFFRALSYARQSLYNDCEGCPTLGYVHLTVGAVSLELGAFTKAVDSFQKAHKAAQNTQDNALLLQVNIFENIKVIMKIYY